MYKDLAIRPMYKTPILKQLVFVFILSVACFVMPAQAQKKVYGNEWINHDQTYYKIKVVQTGLYRLDFNYLNSLGLSGADPRNLQLFRRGQEIPIYVKGEQDGKLDSQDYVEFIGERNDGALDSELYKEASYQPHQLYSYYTDTAAYFLTLAPTPGKRVTEVNPSITGKTSEPYHLQKSSAFYATAYKKGKTYGASRMSWLDIGEGWTSGASRFERAFSVGSITNVETTGPKPQVTFSACATNNIMHYFGIKVGTSSTPGRVLQRFQVDGDGFVQGASPLEFSDISTSGTVTLWTSPDAHETTSNQISMVHAIVTYPRKNIFSGNFMVMYTDSSKSVTPYYEFTSAPAGMVAYDISDLGNISRIEGYTVGTKRGFVVPAENGKSHKIFLTNTASFIQPPVALAVNFRRISPVDINYTILTNKRLMVKVNNSAKTAPEEYEAYRASAVGGGYSTLLVTMDEIVDQFHYGEYSANSISRFISYLATGGTGKHFLILGKGIEYDRISQRSVSTRGIDLVPTAGTPASDVLFAMDFRNNSFRPSMPVGRIAATNATDIINYLNKVKEYEAVPEGLDWRKNILQLGGGKTIGEINQIASYLKGYGEIARGPYLGGRVIEKYRQNVSEVVEVVNISDELNKGLSLITFFGHSSPGTTDLDIGYVSSAINNYKNKGKYPIMLMNGCNVGDAYTPNSISFGEDWLNTPDKGAVALIAHTDAGYPNYLDLYSSYFYSLAFRESAFWGTTLGQVQQETIARVAQTAAGSDIALAMITEMALQGDPAIKVYNPSKPDYLFKDNTFIVSGVSGETVTAASEQFVVTVNVNNLGKTVSDSVTVTVKRTLSDNTTVNYDPIKVGPIMREGKIQLKLHNRDVDALGMNQFEIKLDGLNLIDELNENNNTVTFQHYFPVSGLVALSPANFGIVGTKQLKLAVQATHLDKNDKGFYFELDTTQLFNSNLKQSHNVAYTLLPSWDVSLPEASADSTVYYWRARFETYEAGEDTVWAAGSFRYIPAVTSGWSQSHYGQFAAAVTDKISNQGKKSINWDFQRTKTEIAIKTIGGAYRYTNPPYGIFMDAAMLFEGACGDPGGSNTPRIFAIVIDDKTLKKVEGLGASYCTTFPYIYEFGSMSTAANRDKIIAFMNAVPAGNYVVAMSVNNVPFESFTTAQKAAFGQIGSTLINSLKNGYPFAIIGRKGAAAGTANEKTGLTDDSTPITSQVVILNDILYSRQPEGTITSTVIGPALKWNKLYHNIEKNQAGNDSYTLSVIGINNSGEEQVLQANVTSKEFDLSGINAADYPTLKLKAVLSDSEDRTAPQLREWFVLHDAAPEGVIRPDLVNVSEAILTEQALRGSITVPMAFQNLTATAFQDSVTVEVTLTGEKSDPVVSRFKIKPVGPYETVNFQYSMSTLALESEYKLSMFVNPRILPEQQYFNNIYEVNFKAKAKLHPIMDVAFDGMHILDGEIVSPTPLISVTVKDENRFVHLQDPSAMSMVLIHPEDGEMEVDLTNANEVRYFPADEKNDFRLEYKPVTQLKDGKYALEVRANDASGKASGISPYRISFEVVNESKITNFYPFPNPFSSKTNFIFTITGNQIPEHIKIQIMTVTGKVVREITKEEIGPLRIGNNKTEYAWDGTDTYGDKLANGVYLYRVVMSQVNETMYHMYKNGDKSFKNGYGKLYILR